MKIIQRITLAILIASFIGFLFRGWLYRNCITYKSIDARPTYKLTNKELIDYIEEKSDTGEKPTAIEIIKASLSITSEKLNYTAGKNSNDPNELIVSCNAHCIGYASFFSTTCNYLLKKHRLDSIWTAKSQAGQLYFLGLNIHKYFHSSLFKDHDFVIIENRVTGEIIAVDPTIHDYFDIDFVTYRK